MCKEHLQEDAFDPNKMKNWRKQAKIPRNEICLTSNAQQKEGTKCKICKEHLQDDAFDSEELQILKKGEKIPAQKRDLPGL